MSIRYDYLTGHFDQVCESLRRALGQYARHCDRFKVGLTVDPEQRWTDHAADKWTEMVVVYHTSSSRYAAQMEKELIQHGWNSRVLAWSWNEVRGGGGLRRDYYDYYIYVLLG